MTLKETIQLIIILKEYYPISVENENIETKAQAWYMILKDHDPNIVTNAALAFVATDKKGFMPTPGQILGKIETINCDAGGAKMTEMEAWGYVAKALRNSTYNSVAEWEKFPKIVQECVTPSLLKDWATIEEESVQTVVQSHFARNFRAKKEQKEQRAEWEKLPKTVQEFSLKLSNKLNIEG